MIRIAIALLLVSAVSARAQSYPVYQVGRPFQGHAALWMNNGRVGDAGGALSGQIQSLGITPLSSNPLAPFCINDTIISNPTGYHEICISSNALGGGGQLTYNAIGGALSDPFLIQSASTLSMSSNSKQIAFQSLPPTASGDVAVCINATTGQLFQASTTARIYALTDDSGSNFLTDDTGSFILTGTIPAGKCVQQ